MQKLVALFSVSFTSMMISSCSYEAVRELVPPRRESIARTEITSPQIRNVIASAEEDRDAGPRRASEGIGDCARQRRVVVVADPRFEQVAEQVDRARGRGHAREESDERVDDRGTRCVEVQVRDEEGRHGPAGRSPAVCPFGEYLINYVPEKLHFMKDPPLTTNGLVQLPGKPGFGIELDPARVEKQEVLTSV
jgi:hypothetical protein